MHLFICRNFIEEKDNLKVDGDKKNSWNYAHEEFSRDKYVAYSHRSDFDKYIPLIYVRNILKYDQVNVVIFKFV